MATLNFYKSIRIIEVASPGTEVTIQELTNKIRDYEDNLQCAMDIEKLADITGKDDLGGGVFTGITLKLLNDWRIRFEDRPGPTFELVKVTGGNLAAINVYCNNPIASSAYTQVVVQLSSSATLQQSQTIENIQQAVEAQNPSGGAGNVYYWDPLCGNDLNDGLTIRTGKLTFQNIHDNLISSGNDDIVYIRNPNPSVVHITIRENLTISKNSIHLRGLGPHTKFRPYCGVAITVTGHHVELRDFEIDHRDICGVYDGIYHSGGSDLTLHQVYFTNITGVGFHNNDRDDDELRCNHFRGCNIAIQLDNAKDNILISNEITDTISDGIKITSSSPNASTRINISNSTIINTGGYGINIGTNTSNVVIKSDTDIFNNTLGRILDNGTSTFDGDLSAKVKDIWEVETGTWKIVGTQMIFYQRDGVTEIFRRDLKDSGGNPSVTDIYQGVKV